MSLGIDLYPKAGPVLEELVALLPTEGVAMLLLDSGVVRELETTRCVE